MPVMSITEAAFSLDVRRHPPGSRPTVSTPVPPIPVNRMLYVSAHRGPSKVSAIARTGSRACDSGAAGFGFCANLPPLHGTRMRGQKSFEAAVVLVTARTGRSCACRPSSVSSGLYAHAVGFRAAISTTLAQVPGLMKHAPCGGVRECTALCGAAAFSAAQTLVVDDRICALELAQTASCNRIELVTVGESWYRVAT